MDKKETVGIIYAGGMGARLAPYTGDGGGDKRFQPKRNKQALPLGELGTPMFGYPLAKMMQAGIQDVLICTSPVALEAIKSYYGDGSQLGIHIHYTTDIPDIPGPARNLYAAKEQGFIQGKNVCVIYGDVSVHPETGSNLPEFLDKIRNFNGGALIATMDADEKKLEPRDYGIISRNSQGQVIDINEKPQVPASKEIHVGISIFDDTLSEKLEGLKSSTSDGELRETDISKLYAKENKLDAFRLDNTDFIDCGNKELYRSNYAYVRKRIPSGSPVATPEDVARTMGLDPQPPSARITDGRGPLSRFDPIR